MRYSFPICLLLFLPTVSMAATNEPVDVPEPPDLPLPVQSGEEMEPDITITRKGEDIIHEYRRNGQLYMIKVIPPIGPPYYWLDINRDGQMDVRKNDMDENTNINMWNILQWD